MLRNRMRAGIERGEAQIGTWLTLVRNPSILMLMKAAGLDFARIDMEHTSLTIETISETYTKTGAGRYFIPVHCQVAQC